MKRLPGSLDDFDIKLLAALQSDGRATFAELAEHVGLKTSAIYDRVKRLELMNVVVGYSVRVNPVSIGLFSSAFINVFIKAGSDSDAIAIAIASLPEVQEIYSIAGEATFKVHVLTESPRHLHEFLKTIKQIGGIARTTTTVVLETRFERGGISVESINHFAKHAARAAAGGGSRKPGIEQGHSA